MYMYIYTSILKSFLSNLELEKVNKVVTNMKRIIVKYHFCCN